MTLALATFVTHLGEILQASTTELPTASRYEMVKAAVERYSRDKPDERTEDVTGDAGKFYVLTTILDQWVTGFSRIKAIQYPAPTIASDESPQYLRSGDWDDNYIAEASGAQTTYLYLPNHAPAATETMRITYTTPYKWVASASTSAVAQVGHGLAVNDYIYQSGSNWVKTTSGDVQGATNRVTAVADADNFTHGALVVNIQTQDFFAVCYLSACLSCRGIAVRYASASDGTITADSTAHTTKSSEFAQRAEEYCNMYLGQMGLATEGQGSVRAASEQVEIDWQTPDVGARSPLFRRNR